MKKSVCIPLLLFLLIKPVNAKADMQTPSNPSSTKECAICHYRWIETFFIDGKGTDIVDYHSEKVVADPDMCFSCHDGSIKDSRARMGTGKGHKTGVRIPDGMVIPDVFPLDGQGKMQCATCHTAHGVPSGPGTDSTVFMRTSNKDSAMCRMCHPDMMGGPQKGNHPLGALEASIPDELAVDWSTKGPGSIVCESCHTAHGSRFDNFLKKNDRNASLCLSCHKNKRSLNEKGEKNPTHIVNILPKRATIPDELMANGAKTGKNNELICQTCHKIHQNRNEEQLLILNKNKGTTLCLTCHLDKKGLMETKHNLSVSAPNEINVNGKTAKNGGVCSPCHEMHQPARRIKNFGEGGFTTAICLSCHSNNNMAEKVTYKGMAHPINVKPGEPGTNKTAVPSPISKKKPITLPLYEKNGSPGTDGYLTCATCHDPHNRHKKKAGRKKKQKTKGDAPFIKSFLRIQEDFLCKTCHQGKFVISNSKHNLQKSAPDSKNILKQKPFESGICASCHSIHREDTDFPWAREPMGEKDPCMICHDKDGLAEKKIRGDSHPVNIPLPGKKRMIPLPLYEQNTKVTPSGKIKCRTCHTAHGNTNFPMKGDNELETTKKGNAKNNFLRQKSSPSPVLCKSCHINQKMIEKTDHDLVFSAPESTNINGKKPHESGTCGVCHLVHNNQKPYLWARKYGKGDSIMEKMCNECHHKKGSAKKKIPATAYHPSDKLFVTKAKRGNRFPLFDKISGKPVNVETLSCPSCHDAHNWYPDIEENENGKNIEGDTTNSFLRSKVEFMPCMDCHGPEALLKFLYFHKPGKRSEHLSDKGY